MVPDQATATEVRSDDAPAPSKPSPGALLLYRIIYGVANASPTGWCDYSHDDFAKEMECDPKTVLRYLAKLKATGRVDAKRRGQGRTNLYRPLAGAPFVPKSARVSVPEQTGVSVPEQTGVSVPEQTGVSVPTCDNKDNKDSSSAAAAVEKPSGEESAAPSSADQSAPEVAAAAQELRRLGLHAEQAEHQATRDPRFALDVAVPHFRARFADPTRKPVGTRIGYMVGFFADPAKYGCDRDPSGRWRWPPGETAKSAGASALADRTRQLAEETRRAQQAALAERRTLAAGGARP